jgi:hypothetical protein
MSFATQKVKKEYVMQKKLFYFQFVALVIIALALSACGTKTVTVVVTATPDTIGTLQSQITTLQAPIQVPTNIPLPAEKPTQEIVATQPPATSAVVQQPPTGTNCGNSNLQVLYLTVVNPQDAPQPQIGHPSAYAETHVSGTAVCVVLDVPQGYKAIVGGVTIDKLTDGVYQGYGPGHIETVVTNGFALITTDAWAKAEWDFRIQQTITYGWAHTHIDSGPIK